MFTCERKKRLNGRQNRGRILKNVTQSKSERYYFLEDCLKAEDFRLTQSGCSGLATYL